VIYFVDHPPPSAKFVLKVLREKRQVTQEDLLVETSLPKRTVNHAIRRLRDCNLIKERRSLDDVRQKFYICLYCTEECPARP